MHKLRHTPGDPEEALTEAIERVAGEGAVYVLGLGYVDKADDGAGVLVANALKSTFPEHSFSEHDGVEGVVLDISERSGPATVFFVDAGDFAAQPGTVEVVPRELIKDTETSTHRVPVALMAAMLERSGKKVAIIAIQPRSLEFRGDVSEEVRASVKTVVEALSRAMHGGSRGEPSA
jgi:hydrogenase maturation protease